jgi:hypothetical protein
MERDERIYIPPKRGYLPWHYRERPSFTHKQKLRLLALLLLMCAAMAGLFWLVLKVPA